MKRTFVWCLMVAGCNSSAIVFDRASSTGDGGQSGASCGLSAPAFCETFETPRPGGRGGDLDEARFSFTRWGHQLEFPWQRIPAHTYTDGHLFPSTFCGAPFSGLLPDADVRACAGLGVDGQSSLQLNEVFDDQGAFGLNSIRIRQPFDFAGRTGTVVWDVDGKVNPLNLGHGWWFEVWITDDTAPLPHDHLDTVTSNPHRGVGFAFKFGADCPEDNDHWQSALETVVVADGYQLTQQLPFYQIDQADERCFKVADAHLNHFELRLSVDSAELWASDYDDPASLKRRATANGLGLTFSRGYVHFQHGQINAAEDGNVTPSQTFRWDNLGFDGPLLPVPRAYDFADNGGSGQNGAVLIGWPLDQSQTLTVHGVDRSGATSASLSFALNALSGDQLEVRVNGGAPHVFTYPATLGESGGVHGFAIDIPLAELVDGDNSFALRMINPMMPAEGIADLDLTLEVAQ